MEKKSLRSRCKNRNPTQEMLATTALLAFAATTCSDVRDAFAPCCARVDDSALALACPAGCVAERTFAELCVPPAVLTYVYVDAALPMSKGWRYDFDCTRREMTAWVTEEADVTNLTSARALAVHHMDQSQNVAFAWTEPTPGVITFARRAVPSATWPLNVFGITVGVNAVTYPGFRVTSDEALTMLGPPVFHATGAPDVADTYPAQQAGVVYVRPA